MVLPLCAFFIVDLASCHFFYIQLVSFNIRYFTHKKNFRYLVNYTPPLPSYSAVLSIKRSKTCSSELINIFLAFSDQVHIVSRFIMNGVCIRFRGAIDLKRLEGNGCLEFDEENAKIEDAYLKQQYKCAAVY